MQFPLRLAFVGMTFAGLAVAAVVADYRALQSMRTASQAVQREFERGYGSAGCEVSQPLIRAALARPGKMHRDAQGRLVEAFHWHGGLFCHEVRVVYRSPAAAKSLQTGHQVSWWAWTGPAGVVVYWVIRQRLGRSRKNLASRA